MSEFGYAQFILEVDDPLVEQYKRRHHYVGSANIEFAEEMVNALGRKDRFASSGHNTDYAAEGFTPPLKSLNLPSTGIML